MPDATSGSHRAESWPQTAPFSTSQPAPPPRGVRADGLPFTTPHVRRLAKEVGIPLTALSPDPARGRVTVESVRRTGERPPASAGGARFSVRVDVGARDPATLAVAVVVAAVRALHLEPSWTGASDVSVTRHEPCRSSTTAISGAADLGEEGVRRAIADTRPPKPGNHVPPLAVHDLTGLVIHHADVPPAGGARLSMALAAPERSVVVVDLPGGEVGTAIRRLAHLSLVATPDLDPGVAARLLAAVARHLSDDRR
jgi:hypothetical protein